MEKFICPGCKKEINENATRCSYCGFDIKLYTQKVQEIYNRKLQEFENEERKNNSTASNYIGQTEKGTKVHEVRCPFCNSSDLTRITAVDKAVNIALFGLFGNKRRYQWHCNNCKTNW